jgi:2-polyprenyl-3-methyl-5-hydroxy-6-metoxy-1,4-benzoquinol methylase
MCPPENLCPVCRANGRLQYEDLNDPWFGSPGSWRMLRCTRTDCQAMWLAPRPSQEDLEAAYSDYYTHAASDPVDTPRSALFDWVKRIAGIERQRRRIYLMYLEGVPPGRLLDVGCGNGDRLLAFKSLGWEVEGQEVDPLAHQAASSRGLQVHLGELTTLNLRSGHYDAIVLNHVIEHLSDASSILLECRRLLSSEGRLVIVTPNASSLGHRLFRRSWRGLEPPRHLLIHTPSSLATVCRTAGFSDLSVHTDAANAHYFFFNSILAATGSSSLTRPRNKWPSLVSWGLYAAEKIMHLLDSRTGEEIVLVARQDWDRSDGHRPPAVTVPDPEADHARA